jgi:hypothetical protein
VNEDLPAEAVPGEAAVGVDDYAAAAAAAMTWYRVMAAASMAVLTAVSRT